MWYFLFYLHFLNKHYTFWQTLTHKNKIHKSKLHLQAVLPLKIIYSIYEKRIIRIIPRSQQLLLVSWHPIIKKNVPYQNVNLAPLNLFSY